MTLSEYNSDLEEMFRNLWACDMWMSDLIVPLKSFKTMLDLEELVVKDDGFYLATDWGTIKLRVV